MNSLVQRLMPNLHSRRQIQLRDAQPEDAATLAKLHGEAFARGWEEDEFERLLCDKPVRAHVACLGPRQPPVAFVLSHMVVPEAEILSIAVSANERQHGLGSALLTHHLQRLASEGVTTSFLEVEENNAAALRLYERLGYRQVGRRKGYYGAGTADALLMRRDF